MTPSLTRLTDPFAWPLRTSHYLELVNPLWTTHKLQARVVAVWDETASARTLTLQPGRSWRRHRAGQHVRVGVPLGGMHHTRTYSISSAPERDDGCITITVKAITGGRMSHHLVRNVLPGRFNWPWFGIALVLMSAPPALALWRARTRANDAVAIGARLRAELPEYSHDSLSQPRLQSSAKGQLIDNR